MISNFTSLLHSIRGHLSRDTIPESDLEKLLDISSLFFVWVPLYLIYVLSSISCKNRSQGYHLAPTTVAGGTRSIGTSYQLSNPKKEQTAFSWCTRSDWPAVNGGSSGEEHFDTAKTRATRYGSYTIYKCESIWSIGFIDWLTIPLNYSDGHEYRRSSRSRRKRQKPPSRAPKYKGWRTSWEWLVTGHISRSETLEKRERSVMRMSCPSFPTTYLRVGAAFCDNYSA